MANTKRKLVSQIAPKSPISEQYKTIRTNINFSSVDREMRSIMVTSSGPGEGKSTTAANMAVVFAQQGKSVLLVDADMRKPTAHYTFNVTNTFGLTTVLTRQKMLREVIHPTEIEHLDLLTCGPVPPNPAELLSSRSMEEFLVDVYADYDMVIFDTPPVLAVTDAQVLANQCHGSILVVSSGTTEIESAQKAKELLQSAKGKLLGVILNNREIKDTSYYYYYGKR
ncbi:CpsD/CapB family tyrosine-protein kinase [Rossellomorea vietnamensis]|uniref:CpsD/CapB family tyrosine-protein kinase n=1 Tax=Rossellomorea vietnamensis TaxID=218284 RepID=UPI001CCD535A|nr:CpsD/CapB family tyrosine-protein kinase [Rossellomorea vietnamensis]MCA0150365.1 CpsD/CapB family tyrosine-protein kinase [Rossellomorea vietnamensis]